MNISTGGPHILLFERDQQLATLLTSELQLAGYTNHVARTAVEVFDAIARHPVRIVLVDLAQAAAARREFWVALDTQRRDRKVQVLTFHCYNLASYGSRDFEDHTQNSMADVEVDGMLGLMNLVDAIRTRVPLTSAESGVHTLPRLPRVTSPMETTSPATMQRSVGQSSAQIADSNAMFRPAHQSDMPTFAAPSRIDTQAQQPSQTFTSQPHPPSPQTGLPGANQPSYSEKIRAVLYPNQRNWNTHNADAQPAPQENASASASTQPGTQHPFHTGLSSSHPVADSTVLQQLANGQLNGGSESGLAQLSRMAQGFRSPGIEEKPFTQQMHTRQEHTAQSTIPQTPPAQNQQTAQSQQTASQRENPWAIPAGTSYSSLENKLAAESPLINTSPQPAYQPTDTTTAPFTTHRQPTGAINVTYTPSTNQPTSPVHNRVFESTQTTSSGLHSSMESNKEAKSDSQLARYSSFFTPTARTIQQDEPIGGQPLRASPIQDMPIERTVAGPAITEGNKRTETHMRPSPVQQQATAQTQSAANTTTQAATPLASIVSPMPQIMPMPAKTTTTASPHGEIQATKEEIQEREQTPEPEQQPEPIEVADEKRNQGSAPLTREDIEHRTEELVEDINEIMTNSAVLLDIVQSFPPMPAVAQAQAIQPQVLNGRATRSLNKVLLDGHLVPQDRLEVAQNIQRMLRGVDLNYQLGDILLMFKLLTPDQLLAASLVSYGLINTTQISALGRIRQELHAMGLEYDLENLLILFRILTPEQLREVRSMMQS